ncbi:MAG: hypothetical protein AB7O49_07895 [Sphingomonadales bacterium]
MQARFGAFVGLCALAAAGLSACGGATPYQPAAEPGRNSSAGYGYSEQRLEQDRFMVMFSGNSMTSRQRVETYLLFRAAELTLQTGNDWFLTVQRGTDRKTRTVVDRAYGVGPYPYWAPYWRYSSPRFGWRYWDPYVGDPFWDGGVDVRNIDRYEASAEIVMGRGPRPDDPRAFMARDVIGSLQGRIEMPR